MKKNRGEQGLIGGSGWKGSFFAQTGNEQESGGIKFFRAILWDSIPGLEESMRSAQLHGQRMQPRAQKLCGINGGATFILVFVVASSFRDVYFSGVFQAFGFFEIILIAFSLCTAVYAAAIAIVEPRQYSKLLQNWLDVLLINATTAAAWISYFYGLKNLEPSIAHTVHVGIGPVTITILNNFGAHISRPAPVRAVEKFCHFGVLASLLLLSSVALGGVSGREVTAKGQTC